MTMYVSNLTATAISATATHSDVDTPDDNWTLEMGAVAQVLPLWVAQLPGFKRIWDAGGKVEVSSSHTMSPLITEIPAGELRVAVDTGTVVKTLLSTGVQASLDKADSAYQKPGSGIPKTDLASAVQTSLGKADTALQTVADASTSVKGLVKQAVAMADSEATDAAGVVADLNTLLGKLRTAGLLAPNA